MTQQQPAYLEDQEPREIRTFADLFCGIGGFHYAASMVGLKCAFACDIDDPSRKQYEHNFGVIPLTDIREVSAAEVPDHDLLFAGFPCQPFSIIGARRGLNDERGSLFLEIVRIVQSKCPQAFVLENVKQFATISNGSVLVRCLKALMTHGYFCNWSTLNALDFGLPQRRERTIIVGFRSKQASRRFQWPRKRLDHRPLADILESSPDRKYFASKRIREKRRAAHRSRYQPGIWHENKSGVVRSHPYSCALRAGASYNYLLVDGERRLTSREQLRLQGFPESFEVIGSDAQIRKQVGNAVPVPMIRAVLKEVLSAIASD